MKVIRENGEIFEFETNLDCIKLLLHQHVESPLYNVNVNEKVSQSLTKF